MNAPHRPEPERQIAMPLWKTPNIKSVDNFYAALVALHDGLNDQQSGLINAKLILILANHIGDEAVLAEALEQAGRS